MKNSFLRIAVAIFALSSAVLSANAQENRSLETYAITNARIVTGTGSTIERGNVVIRNGLIESVGGDAKVPLDAQVIDGTNLTVYPGLIDANTNLGFPAAATTQRTPGQFQQQQQQSQAQQSNANYPSQLQPETSAADEIKAGEAQFETIRNMGFTTALTVSRDGIFNGQSALINLAGDSVSEMIIASPVAEHFTFRTIGGGTFPVSLMGTFAAFRQMMLDAQRLQSIKKMYDANPRGIPRPEADKSLEALFPILNREMPIAFNANSEREIIRVLDLAKEFNIKAIIVGGQEAWKVADRLKAQNVPVLLSLNFPKRTAAASLEADPESLELLRSRAEAPKSPARLAAAGVKFAFQDGGMTNLADFLANANKSIENGLPKDAAIRAMTLNAAEIFGVDKMTGSLEKGKIANLIVSRGDLFAKDKAITHVFIDGKLFEQKMPLTPRPGVNTRTPGTTDAFANASGTWNITIEIPGRPIPATLVLVGQGKDLTGSMNTQFGTTQIKNGEVLTDSIRFSATTDFAGRTEELNVNGKINGNQMTGTFTTTQGTVTFSGTRNP